MLFISKKLVKVVFGFLSDFPDMFLFIFGGVFEGKTDSSGDHGFELLFLLNFITVISHYYKKKNT